MTILEIQQIILLLGIGVGILVTIRSFYGLLFSAEFTKFDKIIGMIFPGLLLIEIMLTIYILTTSSFNYEESLRAVEFAALIIFSSLLTVGGRFITSQSSDHVVRFRFRSIYFGLATGLLIYAFIINLKVSFT